MNEMILNSDKPYLIAEIGINHNGSLDITKKLIDAAYAIGWDCVKFQKRTPDVCVPQKQKTVMKETPWGTMTYLDYKKKIEFEKAEYDEIDSYCKNKSSPFSWTASVWDLESLSFILNYDVPFIKIPSAMITNIQLLEECASCKKNIILSTGMSTIEEIDSAFNIFVKKSNIPILLHTNSTYPAPLDDLNLSLIPFFKERYKCKVGYSGHEYSIEPTVIAAALGADVIERHVTLDHSLWGTDQSSSITITGMDRLFNRIKDLKKIIGKPIKKITDGEIEIRKKLSG